MKPITNEPQNRLFGQSPRREREHRLGADSGAHLVITPRCSGKRTAVIAHKHLIIGIKPRPALPAIGPGCGRRRPGGILWSAGDDAGVEQLPHLVLCEPRDLTQDLHIVLAQRRDQRQSFRDVRDTERPPSIDPRTDAGSVLVGENLKVPTLSEMRVGHQITGGEDGASGYPMSLQQMRQGFIVVRCGPPPDIFVKFATVLPTTWHCLESRLHRPRGIAHHRPEPLPLVVGGYGDGNPTVVSLATIDVVRRLPRMRRAEAWSSDTS